MVAVIWTRTRNLYFVVLQSGSRRQAGRRHIGASSRAQCRRPPLASHASGRRPRPLDVQANTRVSPTRQVVRLIYLRHRTDGTAIGRPVPVRVLLIDDDPTFRALA